MATKDPQKRKEHWKKWYEKNKDKPAYKNRIREFDNARRAELIGWLNDIKKTLKCKNCDTNHPAALDFHHRNPKEKLYDVTDMPRRSISKAKILAEIAKCDVLCSNCHRIWHYENEK